MDAVAQQLQRLSASVVASDLDDLQSLATIHTQLQELQNLAQTPGNFGPGADPARFSAAAQTLAGAMERIILRDVSSPEAALKEVGATIAELQAMLDGVTAAPEPAVSAAAAAAEDDHGGPPAAHSFELAETAVAADDVGLVGEFIAEATSHLDSAESSLLELEANPGNHDTINAVFRSFHTIKGVAGFLGLKQIGALAHCAEGLLDLARQDKLELSGAAADMVLESVDVMRTLIRSLAEAVKASRAQDACDLVPPMIGRLMACASAAISGTAAPQAATRVALSESAAPVEETLSPPADATQPTPNQPADQHPSAAPPGPAAGKPVPASQVEAAPPAAAPVPVREPAAKAPAAKEPAAKEAAGTKEHAKDHAADSDAGGTVKVGTARLDRLINLVGELLIARSMVHQCAIEFASRSPRLGRSLGHLGKITRELQDLSMAMRMVPIHGVFQKMARLARDVARKAGKEVEMVNVGGDTELDRNVVEAVSDPLVHMVRNAVDHGLEPVEERLAAGKPRAGRVELRAFHQGGSIVIQIIDDGRGLNRERIVEKAIAAGLVREGQVLSDQEAFALIFHAGLSTAEKITDVSGRGVGMDVVKRNIESLRGQIEISSTRGKGSIFTIRLPLTLAMIDGMVVRVGEGRFIIPMTSIEQSMQPRADQMSTVQGRGEMCMVRGKLLPIYRLAELFSIQNATTDPTRGLIMVLQDNTRRCCMMVDELLGQQQVVIKSLGEGIGKIRGVSGGAILGDGTVSLILEVSGLMDLAVKGVTVEQPVAAA